MKYEVMTLLDYDRVEYRPGATVEIEDAALAEDLRLDGVIREIRPPKPKDPKPKDPKPGSAGAGSAGGGEDEFHQDLVETCDRIPADDPDCWTKNGRPTVEAMERYYIRDIAGRQVVTAAERDEAWEAFLAERTERAAAEAE